MKKLVMILSAVLSFGLFADQLSTGVNFEAFNVGQFDFSRQDNGDEQKWSSDLAYWTYGDDVEGRIEEESGRYPQSDAPDMWKDAPNEKFLHFSSGNAYRTARTCITDSNSRNEIENQPIVDFEKSDVYFDTMLKFVPYEELPTEMPDARAKLSVFAYAPEDGGYTNLVISGGYDGRWYCLFTNYVTDVAIDLDKWHRLTIRAINVGKDSEESAFLVYLDEQLISRREGDDCGFKVKDLSAIGEKYLDSIIPSFRDNRYSTVSAMGFSGTGDVDDLAITDTKPDFIQEESYYTINWSEGVTSIQIDDGEAFAVEGEGYTNVVLEAGVTSVKITATYAKGYERGTWRQGWTLVEGNEFKDLVRAQLYIDAMIPLYDIGGKHYGSCVDVLNVAKNGDTIKLLADVVGNMMFSDDVTDITIDLAGHTITSDFPDSPVICGSGEASITIINSTSKIGKVIPIYGTSPWEEVFAVISCDVVIHGGIFNGVVMADVSVEINGGQFCDPYALGNGEDFYLVCYGSVDVDDVTYVGDDYFKVGEDTIKSYPTYIMDHASDELKDKFDKWVTEVNGGDRDVGSEALEAYFLNCTPDQVEAKKEEFKITLITKDADGNWVVKVGDKGQDAEYGNGYINIISVKADKFPTAGDNADFFQATLTIQPSDKE